MSLNSSTTQEKAPGLTLLKKVKPEPLQAARGTLFRKQLFANNSFSGKRTERCKMSLALTRSSAQDGSFVARTRLRQSHAA